MSDTDRELKESRKCVRCGQEMLVEVFEPPSDYPNPTYYTVDHKCPDGRYHLRIDAPIRPDELNAVLPASRPSGDRHQELFRIFSKNAVDTAWLKTKLEVQREKSYKSKAVGESHVIDVERFRKLWEDKR